MIEILCHSNLDLDRQEIWPERLPEVPRVGDTINSGKSWKSGSLSAKLILKVVSIRWNSVSEGVWIPLVELHINPNVFPDTNSFYEWYRGIRGM